MFCKAFVNLTDSVLGNLLPLLKVNHCFPNILFQVPPMIGPECNNGLFKFATQRIIHVNSNILDVKEINDIKFIERRKGELN